MAREVSKSRDENGRVTQVNVNWTKAGKTDHYKPYEGSSTPKEHTGTTHHDGERSWHEKK